MCKMAHTILIHFVTGEYYILASQKNSPPSKILPCFVDFLRSFKLDKGILTCVSALFSFFFFCPLFLSFFHEVLLEKWQECISLFLIHILIQTDCWVLDKKGGKKSARFGVIRIPKISLCIMRDFQTKNF